MSGFIVGMVVSKLLGPEMLGMWGIFHIITGYYSYANLGSTNGLSRSLGIAIGENNLTKNRDLIGAANAIQITIPLALTIILIIIGFFSKSPLSLILIFSGIVGFISLYEETFIRIISAFEKHRVLANLSVIKSLCSIVFVIPFVFFFDLNGRIFSATLIALILFLITYRKLPVPLSLNFDKEKIKELLEVGFPIGLAGFLAANFFLVDRVIVTKFLTVEELGFYVFGFYLVTVVKSIKQTVANVLYQRQNIIYGEDGTEKKRRLFLISKSAAFFSTDITGILSGLILIVFAFAVKIFMPEFEKSIYLTFIIVFSQVMGQINVLNTVGKQVKYLSVISIALVINIALSLIFVLNWGIIGVAYATFISFLIYNILINYINLKYFDLSIRNIILTISRIIAIPVYCFIISKGIEFLLFKYYSNLTQHDVFLLIFLLILYTMAMIPLFFMIKKDISILNKVKLKKVS